MTKLGELSNDELLARLRAHVGRGNVWLAGLLAYLAEVDARRLYAEQACTSTWDLCVRRLGMSESEAQRRIAVARLVRRFPAAGGYLERGEIHLCALYEVHKYLTAENHEELLGEAVGKTTRAVAEIIAARFPKPDVHGCIEPLGPQPALPVATTGTPPPGDPSDVLFPVATPAPAPAPVPAPATTEVWPRVEPLSASRYRVALTVSAETKAKLERVQALMRHRNPSGDLEKIFEASLDLLEAKLEKERLGKTSRRSKVKSEAATTDGTGTTSSTRPKSALRGNVARAVRREVWERDAEQCTFVDAEGNRCPARGFLELDHIDAQALGGSDEAANLRLRCRAHNRLHAEQVFGREYVEHRIYLRQRKYDAPAQASERKDVAPARAERKPSARAPAEQKDVATARAPAFEAAARGLRSLGFREPQVREVIARLATSLDPDTAVETIVKDALRWLT